MSTVEQVVAAYAFPVSGVTSEPREIADGIWWLPLCLEVPLEGVPTHVHTSLYLLVGDEQTLLWDTGPPTDFQGARDAVAQVLGDRPLDWIAPSHPEVAHAGNLARWLTAYPDARVIGDVRDYHLFFPQLADRLVPLEKETTLDLGGLEFVLVDALIRDLPTSQWAYERTQQVLFVADAFSFSHHPPIEGDDRPVHLAHECRLTSSEFGPPPKAEQVVFITKAALYWTRFVKLEPYRDQVEELLRTHPTSKFAPAHGAVIDNLDVVLPAIWGALADAYDPLGGVKVAAVTLLDKPEDIPD
jgi:hypothetical protein